MLDPVYKFTYDQTLGVAEKAIDQAGKKIDTSAKETLGHGDMPADEWEQLKIEKMREWKEMQNIEAEECRKKEGK